MTLFSACLVNSLYFCFEKSPVWQNIILYRMKKPLIDQVDREIIEILKIDATITNKEIARRVSLTPGPCLTRVQKLWKNKVLLSTHVRVNLDLFGFPVAALVEVGILEQESATFEQFCMEQINVTDLHALGNVFGNIPLSRYMLTYHTNDTEFDTAALAKKWESIPGIVTLNVTRIRKTMKVCGAEISES